MSSGGSQDERFATHTVQPVGATSSSPAYLLVIDGATSRKVTLPRTGTLVVGRDAEADLVLESPSVSRRHVELFILDGVVRLTDLESHNGTRVNGEPLTEPRTLESGDLVALGDIELLYRTGGSSASSRRLLEWPQLKPRLEVEADRARATERPLCLLALAAAGHHRALLSVLQRSLGGLDLAGLGPGASVVLVLPERDEESGLELAAALLERLSRQVPNAQARAGLAVLPGDGSDGATVLGAAESAALAAAPGEVRAASKAALELTLGERRVLVADPAMSRLYELIRRLATSELPVLISGETGVGKENAAWAIHSCSKRSSGPFVSVNCAALPESLADSELLGHERGAFTGADRTKEGRFQAAAGGTLFLDEVGELSLAVQAKLLRVLETRRLTRVGGTSEVPVDLRVVAATNRDLQAEVEAGRFRRDLFFRLGAAVVVLPPLRDRPREIALLARRFLADACERLPREPLELSTGTLLQLQRWGWPGNVRELRNLMDYCAATVSGEVVEPWHLPEAMVPIDEAMEAEADAATGPAVEPSPPKPPVRPLVVQLRDFERRLLLEALEASGGVRTRAAALLALPLRTFKYKLKQHGITGQPGRSPDHPAP
jgi:DNA-binding NtrC family response regulator/pSer/pThr/pTyr-binding forkhead associated (FHA) protein